MPDADLFGDLMAEPQLRRAGMGSHHATSSITDEWITPREILDALGPFDLDDEWRAICDATGGDA